VVPVEETFFRLGRWKSGVDGPKSLNEPANGEVSYTGDISIYNLPNLCDLKV
jgi:hypothetical protein